MEGRRSRNPRRAVLGQHPLEPPSPAAPSPSRTPPTPNRVTTTASRGTVCLNVLSVVLGDRLITPWYPSLYREELVTGEPVERLFVCEWCFRYTREVVLHLAHRKFCELSEQTPGRCVYDTEEWSIYEVDGEEDQLFTQNLSLFAKLFIENKSVCFDVGTFLYYLLVDHREDATSAGSGARGKAKSATPRPPPQIVGFFSKEKLSWDNNNLACILVFPPWQKLGLGQMLMGASYELARREGRLGGPEKPLSMLGKKSYVNYWARSIAQTVLAAPAKQPLSVAELSEATYMAAEDIVSTLQEMQVLGPPKKDESVKLDKGRVRQWLKEHKVEATPVVDVNGFIDEAEEVSEEDEEEEEEEDEDEESQAEEEEEESRSEGDEEEEEESDDQDELG